jgi:hypothetical protein
MDLCFHLSLPSFFSILINGLPKGYFHSDDCGIIQGQRGDCGIIQGQIAFSFFLLTMESFSILLDYAPPSFWPHQSTLCKRKALEQYPMIFSRRTYCLLFPGPDLVSVTTLLISWSEKTKVRARLISFQVSGHQATTSPLLQTKLE